MVSPLQRLRSLRHAFWLGVSERVGWSRGTYVEAPAGALEIEGADARSVAALRERYDVRFEARLSSATSLNNYEYLEILDRGFEALGLRAPTSGALCDVGCASFWYAAALRAFFRPRELVGVELESHRLFRDGRARIDYAHGYLAAIPGAQFVAADYTRLERAADVITAWFPFLTPRTVLAWRLPLSVLAPARLFARIEHNLKAGGLFIMVNHGVEEADPARDFCIAAGLTELGRHVGSGVLSRHRPRMPVLSAWRHTDAPPR